jgi:hypothetical protein
MTRLTLVLAGLSLAVATLAQQKIVPLPVPATDNAELGALDQKVSELLKAAKYQELMKMAPDNRAAILKMVDADQIGTGVDFLRASNLYDDPMGWFETRRSQHEFALTALSLGQPKTNEALKRTWDMLLVSMGKRQRFGFMKVDPKNDPEGKYAVDPVPLAMRRVFDDPEAAKTRAQQASDNAEIKKMRDADQAIREGAIDLEKLNKAADEERGRRKRVHEMLASGVPQTPNDFEAMSLIMQHSGDFDGYRLAHELMMAGMLVGYKSPWLLTATYDRMLLSIGHRQRFATQWWQSGLAPVDPLAMNDRMRLQMGVQRLSEVQAREKEIMKRLFGGLR